MIIIALACFDDNRTYGFHLLHRSGQVQRNYKHDAPVNDVVIHPNQGELISCDQAGSVKIWDLSENTCTHELVSELSYVYHSVF